MSRKIRLNRLIIDIYYCPQALLKSKGLIIQFLNECPLQIGLNKILGPYITLYKGTEHKDWGISGIVVIAESHIAIHTFPEWEYASIDIVSCKSFSKKKALEFIEDKFQPKKMKINIPQNVKWINKNDKTT